MTRRTKPASAESVLGAISDADFIKLTALLRERTGVYLPPGKKPLLAARLLDRMQALGLTSYSDYHQRVLADGGSGELSRMIDAVCTNETRFFRDAEQLDYIESALIPTWITEPAPGDQPRRIRIWSAGCSSGEEAFSVAMLLLAKLPPERAAGLDGAASGARPRRATHALSVEVLGTDISTVALERARTARWPASRMAEVPEAYRQRFFVVDPKTGDHEPSRELRKVVRFQRQNLCEWYYPATGKFDLILSRNVLIYFDAETRAKVARRLVERLVPKGALVLGMSDSLLAVRDKGLRTVGAEQEIAPGLPLLAMVGPAVYTFATLRPKKF
jgi:chemotaxis protein methyltransferase CheR